MLGDKIGMEGKGESGIMKRQGIDMALGSGLVTYGVGDRRRRWCIIILGLEDWLDLGKNLEKILESLGMAVAFEFNSAGHLKVRQKMMF